MVNQVTPDLWRLADHPAAMCKVEERANSASDSSVGVGSTESPAHQSLSQILVEKHGGEVPPDFGKLEGCREWDYKTASVVMAQAFGVPAFQLILTSIDSLGGAGSGRTSCKPSRI